MIVAISSPQPGAGGQRRARDKSGGVHTFAAGSLERCDVDRILASGNHYAFFGHVSYLAWLTLTASHGRCAPDFQRRSIPARCGARRRIERPHLTTNVDSAAPPIDYRFSFADFVCVSSVG